MTIKIGLVDDNGKYRKFLLQQIAHYQQIKVVIEANGGHAFLEKLEALSLGNRPDIVLMDIDMPDMNGIITVANASIRFPQIKYLMLTVFDDDDKIFEAIKCGACGYLLKDESVPVIVQHLEQAVYENAVPMSSRIARKTLELLSKATIEHISDNNKNECVLSEREIEILQLMALGKDYKQIADNIFLSTHTVRKHISNIYAKLHVNSKVQAIQVAQKRNWI